MRNSDWSSDVCSSDLSIDDEATSTDGPVEVFRHVEANLSGTVIFPMTPAQRNGLEDLRLVRFEHEDGELEWLGTYTAYSGREIQSEMLRTRDFRAFMLAPMTGRSEEHTSDIQSLTPTPYAD